MIDRARTLALLGVAGLARVTLAADTPAAAHGGEHAEAPPNPTDFQVATFIAALVLFGLVLFILNKYAWPGILKALQTREEKIKGDIEHAERSRKQAERALSEYEKALAEARSDAARMLDEARVEQQKIAAEIKARTDADLAQMRDAAKRDIESARRAAVADVYTHMAETATAIAGRILARELSAEDQRALVEESLGQLEAARAN